MRRPRWNHSPSFKAKVSTAAIRGDKILAELAAHYDVHANQIQDWKKQLLEKVGQVIGAPPHWRGHGGSHGSTCPKIVGHFRDRDHGSI